jgi:hypothetical protein
MEMVVETGLVHGEPITKVRHVVSEDTLREEGWEACEEIKNAVMEVAKTYMHPEQATWVTVEWTWSPL